MNLLVLNAGSGSHKCSLFRIGNVIGTFQATGLGLFTSQTFTFDSSLSGISEINAISLREVPEPSTYAMLLGGVAALFLIGRRRAKQTV